MIIIKEENKKKPCSYLRIEVPLKGERIKYPIIKIGESNDMSKRHRNNRVTDNPRELIGNKIKEHETKKEAREHESMLQSKFSKYRIKGTKEWFRGKGELIDFIKGIVEEKEYIKNIDYSPLKEKFFLNAIHSFVASCVMGDKKNDDHGKLYNEIMTFFSENREYSFEEIITKTTKLLDNIKIKIFIPKQRNKGDIKGNISSSIGEIIKLMSSLLDYSWMDYKQVYKYLTLLEPDIQYHQLTENCSHLARQSINNTMKKNYNLSPELFFHYDLIPIERSKKGKIRIWNIAYKIQGKYIDSFPIQNKEKQEFYTKSVILAEISNPNEKENRYWIGYQNTNGDLHTKIIKKSELINIYHCEIQ